MIAGHGLSERRRGQAGGGRGRRGEKRGRKEAEKGDQVSRGRQQNDVQNLWRQRSEVGF